MIWLNSEVCPWREKMLIACAGRRKSELPVITSIQTDRPMSGFTYDELPDIRKSLSQLHAEIGMGNEDKSFSSLSQRPSIQIHCAKPSHHPVHVSPGRYPRLWVFELPHINPLREHYGVVSIQVLRGVEKHMADGGRQPTNILKLILIRHPLQTGKKLFMA